VRQRQTIVHAMDFLGRHAGRFAAIREGLPKSQTYQRAAGRTIIIGPISDNQHYPDALVNSTGEIPYSFIDPHNWYPYAGALKEVERKFGVTILVGRQKASPSESSESLQEIILIDADKADIHPVNAFKAWLFEEFGIESLRYEHHPEYERYVKFAPAALAALRAVNASTPATPGIIIAYDYPAVPIALAAIMDPLCAFKTLFYALEVPTVRRLVESNPGHDTMFLHAMHWAKNHQFYLPEIFGPQENDFQYILTLAGKFCDHVTAVNRKVSDELHFLGPDFNAIDIDLVPVGLSVEEVSVESKLAAKDKLRRYAENLLGYRPDHIFSHVGHMSIGKGFWRDLRVLEHLDREFQRLGRTGAYFLLATDSPPKTYTEVCMMEQEWDWPVAHREKTSDLSEVEANFYTAVQAFNSRSQNIKAVFVNQFGWSRLCCGRRMTDDMSLADLHIGTDAAFGQSIYDSADYACWPALAGGALAVVSRSSGFYDQAVAISPPSGAMPENIIVADYTRLNEPMADLEKILAIDQAKRDVVEFHQSEQVARAIMQKLPVSPADLRALIIQGHDFARQLDWETSCQKYILPGLQRAKYQTRSRRTA
jgi:hypothetical protein